LLSGITKCKLGRLQRAQNAAARVITLTHRQDHITPVLRDLHWLPIAERIEYKCLCLTYQAKFGMAPKYLKDLLQEYEPSYRLRSHNKSLLVIPPTKLVKSGDRAFYKRGPLLWNALPLKLRECTSLLCFKKLLKTHLFRRFYDLIV